MRDDNTIRFDPDEKRSRAANPLGIRQELNRHALTKNLVLYDEFSQRIILNRPAPRPGLQMPKKFEPRPWETRQRASFRGTNPSRARLT